MTKLLETVKTDAKDKQDQMTDLARQAYDVGIIDTPQPKWTSHFATYRVVSEDVKSAEFLDAKDAIAQLIVFRKKFPDEQFRLQRTERSETSNIKELLKMIEGDKPT